MKKIYILLITIFSFGLAASGQSQLGELRGKVIDAKTKKPMDFVSVSIYLNGVLKATAITDDEGGYIVKALQPGAYEIRVGFIGYRNTIVKNVAVSSDNIRFENIYMESNEGGTMLAPVEIISKPPLVDPEGKGGKTISGADIMKSPTRSVAMLANTTAGVETRNGGTPNFRGARADGTAYYIDGFKVTYGSASLPAFAIDQIQVLTGGTPAQYGDFIGGVIAQSTKAPSRNFERYIEYRTASPFTGYLDNTQYNELQALISGPIKIANKGKQDKERVLLGFLVSGSGTYMRDQNPAAVDMYKVKDNVLRDIEAKPLTRTSNGSFINSAEYLTKNDLEKINYKQNTGYQNYVINGNFVYQPSNNISVKFGYQGVYIRQRLFDYRASLMDYASNSLRTEFTIRPMIQFTQQFGKKTNEEEAKKSIISNAFYTIRVAYERYFRQNESPDYNDNFFNYGYIGQFKTYSMPAYTFVSKNFGQTGAPPDKYPYYNSTTHKYDTLYLTRYYKQEAFNFDTLTTFKQADINTIKGNYTQTIFDYLNQTHSKVFSMSDITQYGGLLNGQEPIGVYSYIWTNVGTGLSGYNKLMNETYSLYLNSEASVGKNPKAKHDLQFGFTYEQQIQRFWALAPTGLWTLMGQLVNRQFSGNDSANPILKFNSNGVFQDTVRFNPRVDYSNQKVFDKNLRTQLLSSGATDVYGRLYVDGPTSDPTKVDINTSRINVNMYNPNTYSLKMFSADDLLNNGNSSVSYYGYDYLGNQISGKQSIDKFLNDPQNRSIGAFQPIYMAAWVQDKFVFKDLIVRLGLRMERYDANQLVLKDPYSLATINSVGDVKRNDQLGIAQFIPGNMGDDYKVYIDNEKQTSGGVTHISGFRNGNDWFDAKGNPVSDPATLYKNSVTNYNAQISRNIPYLVNQGQKTPDAYSFTDYVPDVKILPRVWFSFPISTTAQFFGTYDVMSQRPTPGLNTFRIDDYYFINNRINGVLGNPNLKMQQKTNYEIGFRQQIGDNSSLGILAFYGEIRNMLQQYRYTQAWPIDYTTYGNIDFSTTKGFTLEYILRDAGNINLNANYTLMFAEGTGSNSNSSGNLVSTGNAQQRNIFPLDFDTRHILKGVVGYAYKSGKEYNGPIVKGKKILEEAGITMIFNFSSGRPYTQILQPIAQAQEGVVSRTQIKGTLNSANLPSQFYTDVNIDKTFTMKSTNLEGKTTNYRLRIYLEVQNLLNAANVLSVYQYTGSAYDDGYLNSPLAVSAKTNATNTQSFIDLYNTKIVNPGNFAFPRVTRIGIQLIF